MDVDATSLEQHDLAYKLEVVNIIDACRICMAQTLNMSSLFNTDKENIVDEIHFCTGIIVSSFKTYKHYLQCRFWLFNYYNRLLSCIEHKPSLYYSVKTAKLKIIARSCPKVPN